MTTTEARPEGGVLVKNLALALGSILLTLLALEAALRVHGLLENRGIFDRETPLDVEPPADGPADLGHMIRRSENRRVIYELKPGLDVLYCGVRVRTDGDGFRSGSSAAQLRKAGYRVVGIGDSFMFGQGIEPGETYLGLLERRLRHHRPDLDLRVLNMAVPGYNTVMEIAAFEEKALAWRPDLVIIEYVGNDLRLPNFIRTRNHALALDRSYLFDFVERRLHRRQVAPELFESLERLGLEPGLAIDDKHIPAEYRDMVGFRAYVDALRKLRALSLEHGFAVLSITLLTPSPKAVLAASSDVGFHVLDVGELFEQYLDAHGLPEYLGSPLALGANDGHPSALGHRIAAGAIQRYMQEYGLIPSPSRGSAQGNPPGRLRHPGNPP